MRFATFWFRKYDELTSISRHEMAIEIWNEARKPENQTLTKLISMVLDQCALKIKLYNKESQKYLGGIEAIRLISNIQTVKDLIADQYMSKSPGYEWKRHNDIPETEPGKWSNRVIVITNLGNPFCLSYYQGEDSEGVWQRPALFEKGEKVEWWIDMPWLI